jgi:hypothetical protein
MRSRSRIRRLLVKTFADTPSMVRWSSPNRMGRLALRRFQMIRGTQAPDITERYFSSGQGLSFRSFVIVRLAFTSVTC